MIQFVLPFLYFYPYKILIWGKTGIGRDFYGKSRMGTGTRKFIMKGFFKFIMKGFCAL